MSADFAQRATFHQVTFNMFQRNVFGFRNQPDSQHNKEDVQTGVDPEGIGIARVLSMVRNVAPTIMLAIQLVAVEQVIPKITSFQRLDLRAQHPDQRPGAHRKPDDKHQQHADRKVLGGWGVNAHMHHGTEDAHTGRHHQEAQRQGWLTSQRSTRPMAIKVASTLVRPTMTVPHICSVVLV